MVAINLLEVKECMEHLLLKESFDSFSFIEGDITTFMTYHIDGYLKKEFYNTDERDNLVDKLYPTWAESRTYLFQLIKGSRTPLNFKFVLKFSSDNTKLLLDNQLPHYDAANVSGLFLRFNYEDGKLECITGTSTNTFSLDKSLEHVWDDTALKYLKQKGILFENL